MSEPFVAEIRIVPFTFAPTGWALCNGQLMPISQNTALFSLLGTTYGGDGRTTFGLPNLQGSAPMHPGQGPGLSDHALGQAGGEEHVTLLSSQMPAHSHALNAKGAAGGANSPSNAVPAEAHTGRTPIPLYSATAGSGPSMNAQALAPAGGGQPHNNMPPYLVLNFIIALQGVFPARP
ncbi:MAG TPA: tail fiber protein [Candidatus Dormibacteraeota bacterium]